MKRTWKRLIYIVASAFLAWHTLALIIGPAPDSYVTRAFRVVMQPYLTLFRLDSEWAFFAPTTGEGARLRYIIEDASGNSHTFAPAAELNWFHPNYFWFRAWYYAIIDYPEVQADFAAAKFCHKHAALHPVAITFLDAQEERYTRDDRLSGDSRMDPRFFTVTTLKRVECPAG